MKRQRKQRPSIEEKYHEYFKYYGPLPMATDASSLEQPSPLLVVPSVVTDGVEEESLAEI
jgi:hypothetical protein